MSKNDRGRLKGEYRRFSSAEIGLLIRWHRDERKIKRAALALAASVSEKTLERAEAGEGIAEESLRRIAGALGLNASALLQEHFFPVAEDLPAFAKHVDDELSARRERTEKSHFRVGVASITSSRQVRDLFLAGGSYVDDSQVSEGDLRKVSALRAQLQDWIDVYDDVDAEEQQLAAEGFVRDVKALEGTGYVVKAGVCPAWPALRSARISVAVIVFFKRGLGVVDQTPDEVWLPRGGEMPEAARP